MKKTFKAAIFALALTVSVGASAQGYVFNNNLTVGSRGADVTALQNALAAAGYFTATPTGYFGSVTKTAVMAFQRANSISPVSGYFGPLTRTVINSGTVTTPTTPATCPAGYVCPPTTSTGSTSGMEGFGEFRLGTQPVDNTNITTNINVPVYGIEVKAKNSDISFERLTLDVSVLNGSSAENPGTFINKITVQDGSTVLATIPVNISSFSKYTGTNNYYIQLAGLSSKIMKDNTKTFTVSFDTNYIDTSRVVTVGAGASGVRVVDGRGISTYNASAVTSRTHTFKKPGASSLTLQADSVTLYPANFEVDSDEGARDALTSTFSVKASTGSAKITTVTGTTTVTNGTVANVYLYRGSTLLSSRSMTGTSTFVFDIESSNIVIGKDSTETFSIKVDVPSSATSTAVRTSVKAVGYEKADGSSDIATGAIVGPINFFAKIVPVWSRVSSVGEIVKNGASSAVSSISAKFVVNVQPKGGNLATSTVAIIDLVNTSTGNVATSSAVTGSLTESSVTSITENAVKEITYSATFDTGLPKGTYRAVIRSLTWTSLGANGATATSTGLDAFNSATFTY